MPFLPFSSISLTLPAGLAQVFQIGIVPLVGLVQSNIPTTEVTFQLNLYPDYPYYRQLFSFMFKDADTFHFPPADIRIGALPIPNITAVPIIQLWCCLFRRAQVQFGERYANFNLTFLAPYGIYVPADNENFLPTAFIPTEPPIRWFETVCKIYDGDAEDVTGLGIARFTVTGVDLEFTSNVSLSATMPHLHNAFLVPPSSYEPAPLSISSTPHEGSLTYSGTVRIALPPFGGADFPQHVSGAKIYTIAIQSPIGTFVLRKAKILSFTPTLNMNAPLEFSMQLQGLGMFFIPP